MEGVLPVKFAVLAELHLSLGVSSVFLCGIVLSLAL